MRNIKDDLSNSKHNLEKRVIKLGHMIYKLEESKGYFFLWKKKINEYFKKKYQYKNICNKEYGVNKIKKKKRFVKPINLLNLKYICENNEDDVKLNCLNIKVKKENIFSYENKYMKKDLNRSNGNSTSNTWLIPVDENLEKKKYGRTKNMNHIYQNYVENRHNKNSKRKNKYTKNAKNIIHKKRKKKEIISEIIEYNKRNIYYEKPRWKSRLNYIKCMMSYSLKLGVIWRFPYACYINEGGCFLLAYFICLFLIGFPMFLLEITIGQKYQKSFIYCFKELCEKLIGIPISSILIVILCIIYFYAISSWVLLYFIKSFNVFLPWKNGGLNKSDSAKRFLLIDILNKSETLSFSDLAFNKINISLISCVTIIFIILILFLIIEKRKKRNFNLLKYKDFFLCILLFLLFIRSATLEGSPNGIYYYLKINFQKLKSGSLWVSAGSQIFYSLGISWGELINYGSKNNKKNNLVKDCLIMISLNMVTSFFVGLIVFSIIGFMSSVSKIPINEVGNISLGLPFVAYSIGIREISNLSFFSFFFFALLFITCIESLLLMINMVVKTIFGMLNIRKKKMGGKKRKIIFIICFFIFLINIFLTFPSGSYLVDIMDFISGIATIYVLALCEIFALLKYYKIVNFINDIYYMTNIRLHYFFIFMYLYIIPFLLILLFCISIYLLIIPHQYMTTNQKETEKNIDKREGCLDNSSCNMHGICIDKVCLCNVGWKNYYCSEPYYKIHYQKERNDKDINKNIINGTVLKYEEEYNETYNKYDNKNNYNINSSKNIDKDNNKDKNNNKNNGEDEEFIEEKKIEVKINDDILSKHNVKLIYQTNFDFNFLNDTDVNYSILPLNEYDEILKRYYVEQMDNSKIKVEEKLSVIEEGNKFNYKKIDFSNIHYKSFTYDNFVITPLLSCPEFCNEDFGRGVCINDLFLEKNWINNNSILNFFDENNRSDDDIFNFYSHKNIYHYTGKCICNVEFTGKACSQNRYIKGYSSFFLFIGWIFVTITLLPIPLVFFFSRIRNILVKFLNRNKRSIYRNINKKYKKKKYNKISDIPVVPSKSRKKRKNITFNSYDELNNNFGNFSKEKKDIYDLSNNNFYIACKRKKKKDIKILKTIKKDFIFYNSLYAPKENEKLIKRYIPQRIFSFKKIFFNKKRKNYNKINENVVGSCDPNINSKEINENLDVFQWKNEQVDF
ncbi:sodium-and chloride-dependent neutral and basic amino acid transporter, putative [Plasmodium relictum]|uniref:Sodium-and chloride-dependent neutral and basic amino acid transporter, putative n=1 Tax=Plasmodium relictum TaxID=85471 RepID=A0A1J1H398_PLARL|nr:sodium-and chloride-dependent neutral and basic amino acid transporter, putative [Plasmodium relictum]CRG99023.1 sodium-and chloride-dependent neutral and basic amino acid transporter, putative [Plasmodium relictum]